jgi:endonuclease-3
LPPPRRHRHTLPHVAATQLPEKVEVFRRSAPRTIIPKAKLDHLNAFTLLVAVALSAQATDASVNKATRDLFPIADTPEKMLLWGRRG